MLRENKLIEMTGFIYMLIELQKHNLFICFSIINKQRDLVQQQRWNVFAAERAGLGGMPWPRPSSRPTNQVAETVSRRPRSPNRRKTKPRITTKLVFYILVRVRIHFFAPKPTLVTDIRCFSSLFQAFWAMLFICSKGGLETAIPCPISSVVFLLSPGFSMLLVQKWGLRCDGRGGLLGDITSISSGKAETTERTESQIASYKHILVPCPLPRRTLREKKKEKRW